MSKHCLNTILVGISPSNLTLTKGDYLFHQGDSVNSFFYVKTGRIKLIRDTVEGGQVLIYRGLTGETLAEASLFSDVYHCSAIADAKSELMVYKKSELLIYIEHDAVAMQALLKVFAQQVRDLRSINEIKNIRSAYKRVLAYITYAMNEHNEVHLDISLKDMAYKIGLAHETFYRELKNLENHHVIIRKQGYVKLL